LFFSSFLPTAEVLLQIHGQNHLFCSSCFLLFFKQTIIFHSFSLLFHIWKVFNGQTFHVPPSILKSLKPLKYVFSLFPLHKLAVN
jgi:hypothetical protein